MYGTTVMRSTGEIKGNLQFNVNCGGPVTFSLLPGKFDMLSVKVTQEVSCSHFIYNYGPNI